MFEKPDIRDERIVAVLQNDYGLRVFKVDFLPLGVDRNTDRVMTNDQTSYFPKLRRPGWGD